MIAETMDQHSRERTALRRRTLSVRVLVVSLLLVLVTGPSLFVLRKWQLSRTAVAYLERADELEGEERWIDAADYIGRYLTLRPREAQAEIRLAETFAKGADTPSRKARAVSLYYLALGNDLKDKQWPHRQKLVDLLLELGRFAAAETEARKILAHDGASLAASKSLALALYGQVEKGELESTSPSDLKKLRIWATIDRARQQQPKDIKLASVAAEFLRRHSDLVKVEQPKWTTAQCCEKADACLDGLIAADSANPLCYLARFDYRRRYQLAGVDADLAKALELGPHDPAVLFAAALQELTLARGVKSTPPTSEEIQTHAARAVAHLQTLLAKQPAAGSPAQYLILGESQFLAGKPDDAIATWNQASKTFKASALDFEAQLADAYLDLDRLSEAAKAVAQVDRRLGEVSARLSGREFSATTATQDYRKARLAFQQQDWGTAIPRLRRIAAQRTANIEESGSLRALLMLGQAYSSMGQWRQAAETYDEVCRRNPRLPQVRLAAAQSWLTAGMPAKAAERAEQSLALRDSVDAWFTLSSALYRQQLAVAESDRDFGRFELALAETDKRHQAQPLSQAWQIDLLKLDALFLRWDEGRSLDAPSPQLLLEELESKYAEDIQVLPRLAMYWQRFKSPADADRCIDRLRSLPGGELAAKRGAVQLHRARQEYKKAEDLLSSLLAVSSGTVRQELVREWINLKLATDDFDGVRALLTKERKLSPRDLQTLLLQGELAVQAGRWQEAEQCEQQLGQLPHPAGVHARMLKARRLLATSKSVSDDAFLQAEGEVQQLAAEAPTWPEVASLAASVALRRGDMQRAASHYEEAVRLGETRLPVFENLIGLLERLGQLSKAQEYLQRLEAQVPLNQTLTVLQGAVDLRLDQPERALAAARKAVASRPQDIQARLWLARMLSLNGQPEEAESQLKQAKEIAPQDLRVWTALQLFYVREKKSSMAVAMANQIQQDSELPEAERLFVAAQGFELAGEPELAEESYQRAAAAAPQNAQIQFRMAEFYVKRDSQKAQSALEKSLELDPQHFAARRMLATLLAARGSDEDWTKAERLLSGQGASNTELAGDRRLHAVLLARRSGQANLDQSAKLLEELVAAKEAVPLDRLLLAQVYERQAMALADKKARDQKLAAAQRELETLGNRLQVDWSHFAAIVQFMERRNKPSEIRHWLSRYQQWLTEQRKPAAQAILQLVRLQLKHGTPVEAEKWLDQLEVAQAEPLATLSLRAQWLKEQKQFDRLREHVDAQAESLLRAEETEVDKAKVLSAIAAIYQAVDQLADAERWQRRLSAHDPKRYDGLAAVLTLQGKWPEALDLCRQAAESDKTPRPALIALSCLSSTQVTDERAAECEPLVQTALQSNQASDDLHYSLGVLRVIQGRNADAIAEFREVIKHNSRHVPALNNLALLLSESDQRQQRQEALQTIDRAIDLVGLTPDLCDTKGTILLLDGQLAEAVRYLELATQGSTVDPRFYFHLALACHGQGDEERARQYLELADEGELETQILTEWDQRKLGELRQALSANLLSQP